MGSPVVCRAEGTLTGFYWWARAHKVTRAEGKGRGPREHSVPALPAVFPITDPGQGRYVQLKNNHSRRLQKKELP